MRIVDSLARFARLACTAAITLGCVCASLPARAQSGREPRVLFYYLAPPDTIRAMYGKRDAVEGHPTLDLVMIDSGRESAFRTHAPTNLVKTYDALQPGTPLRKRVDEVLQINGGATDVYYYLIDDRIGLKKDESSELSELAVAPRKNDGKFYVWPATFIQRPGGGEYEALIGLGTSACDTIVRHVAGGWKAWEGTILHETSHTQFVGPNSRWAPISVVYGGDQSHFWSELLGDQELTMEEGLGNFYGLLDNPAWAQRQVVEFFRDPSERYWLDSRSLLSGRPEVWDAPHVETINNDPKRFPKLLEKKTGTYIYRQYKWADVPGFYVLFNETSSTAFHYFFWKHAVGNRDTALAMIRRSEVPMTRNVRNKFLAFSVNRLALDLEDLASRPDGQALRKDGKLTSSLYPYALLDLITHFGMTEEKYKQELTKVNPDRQPRAFKEYWGRRDAIRQLVTANLSANPIQIEEAAKAIHDYCRRDDAILASIP